MSSSRQRLLGLLAVLVATALLYSIGLNGPLVFDDTDNLRPINRWLTGEVSWLRVVLDNNSGRLGRPVSMASFILNVWLFGPTIWGFKLVNLVIHLVNGALVYCLFGMFLQRKALADQATRSATWLPLLGAAIWLLHPLFVSTVLYVVQRMAMLSAMFMLMTLLAYLHGRTALEEGRRRKAWLLLLIGVPVGTALAAFSKENGILAPALCALLEWFAFAPPAGRRRAWPSRLVLIVGLLLPTVAGLVLTLVEWPQIVGGYANRPFTLEERLMTQGRVLWSYIGSFVLPFGPRLGLYHDDYVISRGLLDPPSTALALLGWFAAIAAAWRARHSIPGFPLGLGIFLIGHALESSVFPLLMYFEHRNYLPAAGAIWALMSLGAAAASRIAPHIDQGRRIFTFGSIALICVLALAVAGRALVWQSQDALLAQGLRHHPSSTWLRIDIAQQMMHQVPPNYSEARRHVDALLLSSEPATRRMAGVWQLLVDCGAAKQASDESIEIAFGGDMQFLEADMLLAFEALGNNTIKSPCPRLGPEDLGALFVRLINHSSMPEENSNFRRMRFKAAQLFLAAGKHEQALEQARLAYSGLSEDAPIGVFLAEMEIASGDRMAAAELVRKLQREVPTDDLTGRRILDALDSLLNHQETFPPEPGETPGGGFD